MAFQDILWLAQLSQDFLVWVSTRFYARGGKGCISCMMFSHLDRSTNRKGDTHRYNLQ